MEADDKPRSAVELAKRILDPLFVLDRGGDRALLDTIVEAIEEFGSACYSEGYSEGFDIGYGSAHEEHEMASS